MEDYSRRIVLSRNSNFDRFSVFWIIGGFIFSVFRLYFSEQIIAVAKSSEFESVVVDGGLVSDIIIKSTGKKRIFEFRTIFNFK